MNSPRRDISEERQTLYYVGMALMGIGLVLFLSVFVTGILAMGQTPSFDTSPRGFSFPDFNRMEQSFHNEFQQAQQRNQSMALRGFSGFILMLIGGGLMSLGARGTAGSGLVLDPQQAREDLEPYSRMVGGMVKDALSETDSPLSGSTAATRIMVRCQSCDTLNDEDARYCKQCGKEL